MRLKNSGRAWLGCLVVAAAMTVSSFAAADVPSAGWDALRGREVVVETQGGKLVVGTLVGVQPSFVLLRGADGGSLAIARESVVSARGLQPTHEGDVEAPSEMPDDRFDGVRVRGGFSVGGGLFVIAPSSASAVLQPATDLSARIGVQLNRLFSLSYQNMAMIVVATDGSGVLFYDYNTLLVGLTVENHLDLAAGPSIDALAVSSGAASASAVNGGLHARLAYNIFTYRQGPRRSGFSVGLDVHPTFVARGVFTLVGLNVGYEWF